MTYRKKLIEVALPLDAINREASREKTIRPGHPSTLHLWWSRKPLAACRAVLFASLVDDPSSSPEDFPTEEDQDRERQRLFQIIEKLVKWKNVNNECILTEARAEILKSTDGNPPPVLDPFCGGGSIPLEAQRLGLEAHASDLNPVAVLITKAMIEIPPRFAGQPPVNPDAQNDLVQGQTWKGASGLAEDMHYYGKWMRDEAWKRIGHLYPKVELPKEHGGGEAAAIAWLWARTVKCPNPACGAKMPLVNSFWLSRRGDQSSWIEPIINKADKTVTFEIRTGNGFPPEPTQVGRGARFRCVVCKQDSPEQHIKNEGMAGKMGSHLMAIVAQKDRDRIYLPPSDKHVAMAAKAIPQGMPETNLPEKALGFNVQLYGMTQHSSLFTSRQLTVLTTFSDLVIEAHERVLADANMTGRVEAKDYADAVATYLAFASSKLGDRNSSLVSWDVGSVSLRGTFARQTLSMVWDYCETNPFESMGGFDGAIGWIKKTLLLFPAKLQGMTHQLDAAEKIVNLNRAVISTDPPYYDNIGYADLSDYFYIWLRRSLRRIYPKLFGLMMVPKTEELVANRFRFGGHKAEAEEHFLTGLGKAFHLMRSRAHPNYPMTVYYAFKQSETDLEDGGIASTGWETMLEGLLNAGFQITGTWPTRTEGSTRPRAQGSNALASSVVLACRLRPDDAGMATRRELISALRRELPNALRHLQRGNIAPVDLAQAAIGPGMAVFSQYSKILEADGTPMRVRTALQIINSELDAYFAAQEGDLDPDTRFCTAWFEQHGMEAAAFGDADILARAKNSSVAGVAETGVLSASAGKVRLISRDEYPDDWKPNSDSRLNTWKCTQYLIRALNQGGEVDAGRLVNRLGGDRSEDARGLAYRLYAICERKSWAQEALAYNTLVSSWSHIQAQVKTAGEQVDAPQPQQELF